MVGTDVRTGAAVKNVTNRLEARARADRDGNVATDRQQRLGRLTEVVNGVGFLRLREAANLLAVSEMTVRRDIAASRGRLSTLGGYVMSGLDLNGSGYSLDRELDVRRNAKAEACRHALRLIEPSDTLFVDCGTTMPNLAAQLPSDMNLTVVTYALNIAEIVAKRPGVQLLLIGGLYHTSSASFSGEDGLHALKRVRLNKAFFSAGGVHATRGVSCSNFHEVPPKRAAMDSALVSYLIVDSSKFGTVRPAHFADIGEFRALITEEGTGPFSLDNARPADPGDGPAPAGKSAPTRGTI